MRIGRIRMSITGINRSNTRLNITIPELDKNFNFATKDSMMRRKEIRAHHKGENKSEQTKDGTQSP